MSKPVILTGLRSNTDLHIGNYLGALLPMVDMANQRAGEYQINLFVPDLHSFTTPIDHKGLYAQTMNNVKLFVAAGLKLDSPDVHIYRQSYIPAHSELTMILNCFTGMGEMSRMTQFKDKARLDSRHTMPLTKKIINDFNNNLSMAIEHTGNKEDAEKIKKEKLKEFKKDLEIYGEYLILKSNSTTVGLFDYPVLMAADILLYGATYIPVGDDQTQHLEFTRDIAERMNKKFGELFVVPKPVKEQHEFFGKDQGLRIRDLQDPTKKMSKSDETGKGVIFLTDSPEEAKKKIMSAATDSEAEVKYDYDKRPGISNLLDILRLFGGKPEEFVGQKEYGPLKSVVADKVTEFLKDFQAKLTGVDVVKLLTKLEESEASMKECANQTLEKVQKAVGLRP